MSTKGIMSGKLYVTVDIEFEDAWNDLNLDEQKNVISSNIDLLDDDDLIAELEYRGYIVKESEEK